MAQPDSRRVQAQSGSRFDAVTVERVSNHWMADGGEVDPDLMAYSGGDADGKERRRARVSQGTETGAGRTRPQSARLFGMWARAHPARMPRHMRDGDVDFIGG